MLKICEGVDRNFFCYPEGLDHICYVLVLNNLINVRVLHTCSMTLNIVQIYYD